MDRRKNIKRYLMLLMAIGVVAAIAGGTGTFASFNAEVTNPGNYFQTGSITLNDKVNTGSDCYSSAGAQNVNDNCDTIFGTSWVPGDPPLPEHLTLTNTGSITPSALTLWAPKVATDGTSDPTSGLVCNYESFPGSDAHAYVGSGNPCTSLEIQIQETGSDFTTGLTGKCVFPADGSANCGSNYAPLSTLPSVGSKLTIPNGLAPNTPRYFVITVKYPASAGAADNEFQAQKTHFNLTWHIE